MPLFFLREKGGRGRRGDEAEINTLVSSISSRATRNRHPHWLLAIGWKMKFSVFHARGEFLVQSSLSRAPHVHVPLSWSLGRPPEQRAPLPTPSTATATSAARGPCGGTRTPTCTALPPCPTSTRSTPPCTRTWAARRRWTTSGTSPTRRTRRDGRRTPSRCVCVCVCCVLCPPCFVVLLWHVRRRRGRHMLLMF